MTTMDAWPPPLNVALYDIRNDLSRQTPERLALVAGLGARAAYFANHPEPRVLDFTCPKCKANPGRSCTSRQKDRAVPHMAREDRYARAFHKRQRDAVTADEAVYDAVCAAATANATTP
ncbi:hypothetical protein ITP53_16545 [Nonomuraea sp. K274]|uniref:DNA-binding phage zinc finger domain-containing protein n=1 Tax=Nonomuraea cypriaca TaxID=1187855 RepID=A0A931EZA0_9ACTN|nr:hypothetical protein [Nonomuraea cypriaca]MBF8187312.1 hypothetical protein [Nonomuraea cypriaca]